MLDVNHKPSCVEKVDSIEALKEHIKSGNPVDQENLKRLTFYDSHGIEAPITRTLSQIQRLLVCALINQNPNAAAEIVSFVEQQQFMDSHLAFPCGLFFLLNNQPERAEKIIENSSASQANETLLLRCIVDVLSDPTSEILSPPPHMKLDCRNLIRSLQIISSCKGGEVAWRVLSALQELLGSRWFASMIPDSPFLQTTESNRRVPLTDSRSKHETSILKLEDDLWRKREHISSFELLKSLILKAGPGEEVAIRTAKRCVDSFHGELSDYAKKLLEISAASANESSTGDRLYADDLFGQLSKLDDKSPAALFLTYVASRSARTALNLCGVAAKINGIDAIESTIAHIPNYKCFPDLKPYFPKVRNRIHVAPSHTTPKAKLPAKEHNNVSLTTASFSPAQREKVTALQAITPSPHSAPTRISASVINEAPGPNKKVTDEIEALINSDDTKRAWKLLLPHLKSLLPNETPILRKPVVYQLLIFAARISGLSFDRTHKDYFEHALKTSFNRLLLTDNEVSQLKSLHNTAVQISARAAQIENMPYWFGYKRRAAVR